MVVSVASWPFIVVLLPRPPGGVRLDGTDHGWPTGGRDIRAEPAIGRGRPRPRSGQALCQRTQPIGISATTQRALSRRGSRIVSVPPIAATRSWRPRMPVPSAASAPPTPLSPTSIRSIVAELEAAMLTLVALACLATLASASDTTK